MGLELSDNLIAEKNKTATSSCWLWFLKLTLLDTTVYRFVRNTEDIVYDGYNHRAAGFEMGIIKSDTEGSIPSPVLKVPNAGRLLQKELEDHDGCEGAAILLDRVNSALLAEDYSELQYSFTVMKAEYDAQWVYFTLGNFNPVNRPYPLGRYKAQHCDYQYKGVECGYAGGLSTCDHTLADCVTHNNSGRFGSFLGMKEGGLKIA